MKHLKFFIKYYKYYYDLEIAYVPDWIFDEKRQQRLRFNYNNREVFHNDQDKEISHVCLWDKNGKKYYKKMSMMSVKEKRQFVADFLSGE
jgi:hypothetical protein